MVEEPLQSQIMFSRFLAVVPSLADSSESVSGQRPNTSVEQGYVTLTLQD